MERVGWPLDRVMVNIEKYGNTSAATVPIALDESITSLGALDAAVALGAGTVVNVKPARCGGPHAPPIRAKTSSAACAPSPVAS